MFGEGSGSCISSVVTMGDQFPLSSPTELITPNTMKSIEQSILESLDSQTAGIMVASAATGSFVPPLPTTSAALQPQQQDTIILTGWQCGGEVKHRPEVKPELPDRPEQFDDPDDEDFHDDEDFEQEEQFKQELKPKICQQKSPRKNAGGGRASSRKRAGRGSGCHDGNATSTASDEEERKRIRRERNKQAAARCRKRRVDHTNQLQQETERLEEIRNQLQEQISLYQQKKEQFEFMLAAHLPACGKTAPTPAAAAKPPQLVSVKHENPPSNPAASNATFARAKRPTSLKVVAVATNVSEAPSTTTAVFQPPETLTTSTSTSTGGGLSISTPSTGLHIVGLSDMVAEWGDLPTGLTPTVPNIPTLVTPLITPSTANSILQALPSNNNNTPQEKYVSL